MGKNKEKRHTVIADLDYVMGYLRYGHIELKVDDKELAEIKAMDKEEQADYVSEMGIIVIDDMSIDDKGPVTEITFIEGE